jgi:hypothetical protein
MYGQNGSNNLAVRPASPIRRSLIWPDLRAPPATLPERDSIESDLPDARRLPACPVVRTMAGHRWRTVAAEGVARCCAQAKRISPRPGSLYPADSLLFAIETTVAILRNQVGLSHERAVVRGARKVRVIGSTSSIGTDYQFVEANLLALPCPVGWHAQRRTRWARHTNVGWVATQPN